jgi:hypothetical protein
MGTEYKRMAAAMDCMHVDNHEVSTRLSNTDTRVLNLSKELEATKEALSRYTSDRLSQSNGCSFRE